MSFYQQDNIKLQEALTMDVEQSLRIWYVTGLYAKVEDIPENATRIKTLVLKTSNGIFAVAVEWFAKKKVDSKNVNKFFLPYDEGWKNYTKLVAKFSKIEELQNTFPQIFELEGYLYAL